MSIMAMTPRQRVEAALHGGRADKVPFTIYESMIPQCTAERELRNRGLCIVNRRYPVFITHRPNVKVTRQTYWQGDRQFVRTVYETPVGTLSTLREEAGFTAWQHEKMFKTPDDYKALLFFIEDRQLALMLSMISGHQRLLARVPRRNSPLASLRCSNRRTGVRGAYAGPHVHATPPSPQDTPRSLRPRDARAHRR